MQILIVEDSSTDARILQFSLEHYGHKVCAAASAEEALAKLRQGSYPLVISDWELPGSSGIDLVRDIRSRSWNHYTYVIILTSKTEKRFVVEGLAAGADDYLTKPFQPQELFFRIRVAERLLSLQGRDVLIFSLAKLAESRDPETGAHLERIREYCRILTRQLAESPQFAAQIDADYIESIYLTSPLHDIGKVGVPDHVLLKPGKLNDQEFELMKNHALLGGETLQAAAQLHPNHQYLLMARDIALTHHERFDGTGYPYGLSGNDIPLCGRIVAVADVYDALTSKRVYKPAFSHQKAVDIICEESGSHFDPLIVEAFLTCADTFQKIRSELCEDRPSSAFPLLNGLDTTHVGLNPIAPEA